MPKMLVFA
jgi:hypothetical protein